MHNPPLSNKMRWPLGSSEDPCWPQNCPSASPMISSGAGPLPSPSHCSSLRLVSPSRHTTLWLLASSGSIRSTLLQPRNDATMCPSTICSVFTWAYSACPGGNLGLQSSNATASWELQVSSGVPPGVRIWRAASRILTEAPKVPNVSSLRSRSTGS